MNVENDVRIKRGIVLHGAAVMVRAFVDVGVPVFIVQFLAVVLCVLRVGRIGVAVEDRYGLSVLMDD